NEFLAIPSISTLSANAGDCRRAAAWLMDEFRALGFPVIELLEAPGHRVVWAESPRVEGKPTVLCYGHYDVQPVDPLDEWISPPFEPTVRDGKLSARGPADHKVRMYMHIKAVEALISTTATLPVNLKFLIEAEEEVGGESVAKYV